MKRIIIAIGMFCALALGVQAKPVDEATARQAGQHYLTAHTNLTNVELSLSYTAKANAGSMERSSSTQPYFYIFNTKGGFIIISADDRVAPVLGYSDEGNFDPAHISPSVKYFLQGYSDQIQSLVSTQTEPSSEISRQWSSLMNSTGAAVSDRATVVLPLVKIYWDQEKFFDDLCPYDNSASQKTVTGCVATAMAQLMRYWSFPAKGIGSHSYYDSRYGMQTANFDTTRYDWAHMPSVISTANPAVARLMYDCGVSVNMQYGIASTGGSAAYVMNTWGGSDANTAEYALKTYFGYASTLQGVSRSDYSDADWKSLLVNELNNKRPIIYSGFTSNSEGHCFIFDGYNASGMFHVNWGWSGMYNGYFLIDALNPGTGGAGSGTGSFNIGQAAIVGIKPDSSLLVNSSIADINQSLKVAVYPNPASSFIVADLGDFAGHAQALTLYNAAGQEVYTTALTGNATNRFTVSTAELSQGVYMLNIATDQGIIRSKVMVQR